MDTVYSAITEPVRRLEVITGAGRRRKWSDEDKARIVAKSLRAATRSARQPDGMDCRRSSCSAGAVSCEEQRAGIPNRKKYSLCRRWWTPWCRRPLLAESQQPLAGLAPVTSTLVGTICFWAVTFIGLTSFP